MKTMYSEEDNMLKLLADIHVCKQCGVRITSGEYRVQDVRSIICIIYVIETYTCFKNFFINCD